MNPALFIDGAYLMKTWSSLQRNDRLDYTKMRNDLEKRFCTPEEPIGDAYYFNADPDVQTAKQNGFHNALAVPPPNGPGLRVKLYWLQRKKLFWPNSMGGGPVIHPARKTQFELVQQKAVDVSLAFHLVRSFTQRGWSKLFFAAGDSDFHECIQHLVENENVDLYLIGTENTISGELKPYARQIIRLDEVADSWSRPRPDEALFAE
jgi:uncharacterized LabA/DUF88 family protein